MHVVLVHTTDVHGWFNGHVETPREGAPGVLWGGLPTLASYIEVLRDQHAVSETERRILPSTWRDAPPVYEPAPPARELTAELVPTSDTQGYDMHSLIVGQAITGLGAFQ